MTVFPCGPGNIEESVQEVCKNCAGAPKPGQEQKNLSRGGQKLRWCPGIGAGAEKIDHISNSNWRSAPPLSLFLFVITKRRRTNR
ncbi:MAG: hypothetical protein QM296_03665 [Bacillota bacterium]|nr:hypothetical protein [Bacillota bacterium]